MYSVHNSVQCTVQISLQYSIGLLGVQGRDIRDREGDRDQSMLGQIYQYGSNVAILARFTFKLEIQVPQF